jgi:hypothetical protein
LRILQKYLFTNARVLVQHFLTSALTIKEIHQRDLGLKTFSRRWLPHFLPSAQNVARGEPSTEILRIPHESEGNDFKGIATVDEAWFEYSYPLSKMFTRSPTDVIPKM